MTISKRKLNNWRKEALVEVDILSGWDSLVEFTVLRRKYSERILILTQELLDQALLNEFRKWEEKNVR